MRLEDLVPPLELCKQIPEGAFADSALCWMLAGTGKHSFWTVTERDATIDDDTFIPAPALIEILEALPTVDSQDYPLACSIDFNTDKHGRRVPFWNVGYSMMGSEGDKNPAAAALKMWLRSTREDEE